VGAVTILVLVMEWVVLLPGGVEGWVEVGVRVNSRVVVVI
jgi:hypothetical protein